MTSRAVPPGLVVFVLAGLGPHVFYHRTSRILGAPCPEAPSFHPRHHSVALGAAHPGRGPDAWQGAPWWPPAFLCREGPQAALVRGVCPPHWTLTVWLSPARRRSGQGSGLGRLGYGGEECGSGNRVGGPGPAQRLSTQELRVSLASASPQEQAGSVGHPFGLAGAVRGMK